MRFTNPASPRQRQPRVQDNPEVKAAIKTAKGLKSTETVYIVRQSGALQPVAEMPKGDQYLSVSPEGRVVFHALNEAGQPTEKTLYKGRDGDEDESESESWW